MSTLKPKPDKPWMDKWKETPTLADELAKVFPSTQKRPNLRIKRVLTVPLVSMAHIETLTCQILEEPHEADFDLGANNESKAIVCRVLNCDTMTIAMLICSSIMISAFERCGGTVTGRYFHLRKGDLKQGRNREYRDIHIEEMELIDES